MNPIAQNIAALMGSLGIILVAAIVFTNAIEWLGCRCNLGHGAVGSVFAAVGTAMPETILPLVAILMAGQIEGGREVGLGAILGAPFMLSTLAMFVVGLSVIIFHFTNKRSLSLNIHWRAIERDIRSFLVVYILAIGAAFVPFQPFKYVVAIGATVGYIIYVHRHITDEEDYTPEELPSPLWCQPRAATPALVMVILQLVVSLALMIGGAKIFVDSITVTGDLLNIPTLVLALIIAPIATELPEKFNSVVWVRTKKDTLAMGNITGAMVFQSTIPVTIGMFFTNWHIDTSNLSGFVSGGIAILSCLTIFGLMAYRKRLTGPMLLFGGLWYIAYLAYLIFIAMPSGIPVSGAH